VFDNVNENLTNQMYNNWSVEAQKDLDRGDTKCRKSIIVIKDKKDDGKSVLRYDQK
jgi:hypothetical protein